MIIMEMRNSSNMIVSVCKFKSYDQCCRGRAPAPLFLPAEPPTPFVQLNVLESAVELAPKSPMRPAWLSHPSISETLTVLSQEKNRFSQLLAASLSHYFCLASVLAIAPYLCYLSRTMPRSLRTEQEVQRIVVDAFEDGIKAARAAMASYMASYVLLLAFL